MIDTLSTDRRPVKLSELTKEIAGVINQHFADRFYWVIAEVTNHKFIDRSGYHYFDLSEKHGPANSAITKIACTAFATGAEAIRNFEGYTHQKFSKNIEVLVKIKVDYSIEYGLRTILYDVDVAFTIGNLEKVKQETLARLLKDEARHIQQIGEAIYTSNKKLSFPVAIKGVALITSKESEGYNDFCHTLTANDFGYRFHLFPFLSKVQSDTAAEEMVNSLKRIYTGYRPYIDAVVICRGGGSQTDFLAFNDYQLCRAIARFPIPIITGIGHHSNQSLVDMLVHTETKTPTKAAEFIVNRCHSFENNMLSLEKNILVNSQRIVAQKKTALSDLNSRIINQTRDLLRDKNEKLNQAKNVVVNSTGRMISRHREGASNYHHAVVSSSFRVLGDHRSGLTRIGSVLTSKPLSLIAIKKNNLQNEQDRIAGSSRKYLVTRNNNLNHYDTLFRHFNVDKILQKGFAIIRKDGEVISDPSKINISDQISVQLKDSLIDTKVTRKTDGTGTNL
jgi:exodeoxyribonuclease VII large subunit